MFLLIFKVPEWSLWWSVGLGWPILVFVWSLRVRRGIKLNLLKVAVVRWPRVAHDSLAPLSVRMRRVDLDQKDHFSWYDPDLWRSDHHLFDMIQRKKYRSPLVVIWSRAKILRILIEEKNLINNKKTSWSFADSWIKSFSQNKTNFEQISRSFLSFISRV